MDQPRIILAHGGGGSLMNGLIRDLFFRYFDNPVLARAADAASLELPDTRIAFTTDAFVVDPIFFPGGDIGKLAVCGTLNDLAVAGATPQYLSVSFILEEGMLISDLERIVRSMADTANEAEVSVVAGDTKVVPKGKGDKVFITTSGIGILPEEYSPIGEGRNIRPGDAILVNGTLGDHGIAVLLQRESFRLHAPIQSDCANLYPLIREVLKGCPEVRFMRDATRGGMATVLCELIEHRPFGIELNEERIPVNSAVADACELLGMDPLYVANEGKVVLVVPGDAASQVLEMMHRHPLGTTASIVGRITEEHPGKVIMKTDLGGSRWIDYLTGDQLPRIC
ncbi:MAG: hydrogenase expression/formation protein HypE [Bacteroidetes bacterium]|nr:MAG: hydrogenase expression/formation protein HypE [Bacteroidota bacterium]